MELWRLIFVLTLTKAAFSATISKENKETDNTAFTSELNDAFHITVPKSVDFVERTEDAVKPIEEKPSKPVEVADPIPPLAVVAEPIKKVEDKKEDEPSLKQAPVPAQDPAPASPASPVSPASPPNPPNIIQQGIQTLQQGIQNITSGITSIVNRPASDNASSPSILQNIQGTVQQGIQNLNQTIQSIVNPAPAQVSSDSVDAVTQRPGFIQQGIQNLQQGVQQGIQNITQAFQGLVNRSGEANATGSTGILQQSIQNLQQGVQQGLANLNQTFQNIARPSGDTPSVVQVVQAGIQNATAAIQGVASSDTPTTPTSTNIFAQAMQNLQNVLQQGITNLNASIQSILNPQQTGSSNSPNFISQGIQTIQSFLGIRPQTSTTTTGISGARDTEQLGERIESLNLTLHEGIKNITDALPALYRSGIILDTDTTS